MLHEKNNASVHLVHSRIFLHPMQQAPAILHIVLPQLPIDRVSGVVLWNVSPNLIKP